MNEQIVNVNLEEQSRLDSQAYAIYVARKRQIPYFTDGLKPVLRRILWCLYHDHGGKGFIKTARVASDVIGKYNPHGDSSVEGAIKNMINDFSSKYPTIDGSGAWGTKVDPFAAQPRYNECKISNFAIDVFMADIKEDNRSVDWQPNYDNRYMEPVYLPARIPILLILGQMGIAVGVKTSIPSHNLGDVIDVTIKLMKNPKAKFVLIPDECMPCEIIDTDWEKICETGRGNYISQGIVETGTYQYTNKGHKSGTEYPCLIIRSLPDFTFYNKIAESIKKLVKNGKMPYIIDLISRSGVDRKNGSKYNFEEIIVLKKGTDPNFVKEFLYSNTAIRTTRQVALITIKDNNLKTFSYRQYLLEFIKSRRLAIYRRKNIRLQYLKTKIHEADLYIRLLTSGEIENVTRMIRKNKSKDKSEIIQFLINKLRVTPLQAKFLSNITLPQLSEGYLRECQRVRKVYEDEINDILDCLTDPEEIDKIIINEMLEIKNKYNNKKLCKIISKADFMGVGEGVFKLIFMNNNYIKKITENDLISSSKADNVNFSITVNNTDNIIIFTDNGKAYKIPVSSIQFTDVNSDGIDIRLLNKNIVNKVICAASENILRSLAENDKIKNFLFILTEFGFTKKMDIGDILTSPKSGLLFTKLEENDKVKTLLFGSNNMDILLYFTNKVLRFPAKQIPYLRRSTKGNRATKKFELMVGMNFALPTSNSIIVLTEQGYVNKLPLEKVPLSSMKKAGSYVIKLNKNDKINSVWACTDESKLIIRETRSIQELPVKNIKEGDSNSKGNKMFNKVNRVVLSY